MKRYIVLIFSALFLFSGMVRAQYSDYYYHRVGDTIEWQSEIGYYSWWEYKRCYENDIALNFDLHALEAAFVDGSSTWWAGLLDSNVLLQRFYTPSPLKIIGIAGSGWQRYVYPQEPDSCNHQNYYYIYDADDTVLTLKAEVPWNEYDPSRTLHIKRHRRPLSILSDSCCYHNPYSDYVPIHEYYFDSAIWVTDSFYVGGSYFSVESINDHTNNGYYMAFFNGGNHQTWEAMSCDEEEIVQVVNGHCYPNGVVLMYKPQTAYGLPHVNFQDREWVRVSPGSMSPVIYPIIEVDTTVPPAWACDPIANVQVTTAGTSATVTWDGFPNYSSILLRYGKAGLPQSQWTEVDVTGNTLYTLTGLQPVSFYGVTLMAECDTSKKETPWSEPVTFYVGTDTSGGGTEGIDGATLLSQLTFLQPNPARDEVTVTSSFNLTAIDIWTADGVMVYHGSRSGHDATLDVSWLRPGTYIISIHTHNGTTHKRLIIQR